MWPNPHFPVDLITFTEAILNEKLHFLCGVSYSKNSTKGIKGETTHLSQRIIEPYKLLKFRVKTTSCSGKIHFLKKLDFCWNFLIEGSRKNNFLFFSRVHKQFEGKGKLNHNLPQPAFTCSKLTTETVEQGYC